MQVSDTPVVVLLSCYSTPTIMRGEEQSFTCIHAEKACPPVDVYRTDSSTEHRLHKIADKTSHHTFSLSVFFKLQYNTFEAL